jgi:hypothetical protein
MVVVWGGRRKEERNELSYFLFFLFFLFLCPLCCWVHVATALYSSHQQERDRKEREMSAKEREAIEAERDSRTVFALNLPIKATERQLWEFFEKAGKVVDVSWLEFFFLAVLLLSDYS